ncbi:MAG: TIGR03088 family PEP-CTERM/XrtA system glycosyltransferase [Gammaproteobacteria bacterium]|nr:TIGR03088 family PEP-CTERM/XrtA system glycosyltransferase [Gammaproteobacteria bacterium]
MLMHTRPTRPIRIAHVVFRFAIGGMENGIVNLINHLPAGAYRHDVVCLTSFDPDFAGRITVQGVGLHALDKHAGQDPRVWLRLFALFRELRPDIVHTRNFGTFDSQLAAVLARVPVRIHGEHGWDVGDLAGERRKYRVARRILAPTVHQFVTVSKDLQAYLVNRVGIRPQRVMQIYNGVDSDRFSPPERPHGTPRSAGTRFTIGTVGRLQTVKNQALLLGAFIDMLRRRPDLVARVRLRIVGAGPDLAPLQAAAGSSPAGAQIDFAGASANVPHELRAMDLFVLPSLAEGVSNTILEAMACGVPVVATRVGGNAELVEEGRTGVLFESEDSAGLSALLERYVDDPGLALEQGREARRHIETQFSIGAMVAAYDGLYRDLVRRRHPEFRAQTA